MANIGEAEADVPYDASSLAARKEAERVDVAPPTSKVLCCTDTPEIHRAPALRSTPCARVNRFMRRRFRRCTTKCTTSVRTNPENNSGRKE